MAKQTQLPVQFDDLKLTAKESVFVLEYCTNGYDEISAVKKAKLTKQGQTPIEIKLFANGLLNKREIKMAVQRFTASVIDPYRDRLEVMLLEADRQRAFYDVADFFDDNGRPKALSEIPKNLRIVIDAVQEDFKGKDADRRVITYKIADRNTAMKNLRTTLKIADGENAGKEDVPDSARARVAEIFKAAQLGIKEGMRRQQQELKKAPSAEAAGVDIEIVEEDSEEEIVDEPSYVKPIRQEIAEDIAVEVAVEQHSGVKRAEKLLSGLNLPKDHPLLAKGREIAEKAIRTKRGKDNG